MSVYGFMLNESLMESAEFEPFNESYYEEYDYFGEMVQESIDESAQFEKLIESSLGMKAAGYRAVKTIRRLIAAAIEMIRNLASRIKGLVAKLVGSSKKIKEENEEAKKYFSLASKNKAIADKCWEKISKTPIYDATAKFKTAMNDFVPVSALKLNFGYSGSNSYMAKNRNGAADSINDAVLSKFAILDNEGDCIVNINTDMNAVIKNLDIILANTQQYSKELDKYYKYLEDGNKELTKIKNTMDKTIDKQGTTMDSDESLQLNFDLNDMQGDLTVVTKYVGYIGKAVKYMNMITMDGAKSIATIKRVYEMGVKANEKAHGFESKADQAS